MNINIRKATKEDLPVVLDLIKELAIYERAEGEVTVTIEELIEDGYGEQPLFSIILAEFEKEVIGISFYFISYSTWKGKCIYLEDLIVREKYRSLGVGKLLFEETILIAKRFGAKRFSWQVLDWNEPAIKFYKKFGANLDPEWLNGRLTDQELQAINLD